MLNVAELRVILICFLGIDSTAPGFALRVINRQLNGTEGELSPDATGSRDKNPQQSGYLLSPRTYFGVISTIGARKNNLNRGEVGRCPWKDRQDADSRCTIQSAHFGVYWRSTRTC
ncbi:hypothetical protein R3P38DRAFT_2851497 [Favolaschia claudopus]|uniref:Secreted protein n=1 Tax=Favolaschia claudopus TaxID=2862362 RepID=A0AAW0DP79_9AGAR